MTVVECKVYKEKIHVNILEELHTRILYGNFVRGILVSKNGFSETAIKFAKIYNIGLYIVNENDAVETIVKRKEKSLNDIVFNSLVNLLYYFDIIEKYSFNYSKVKIGFIKEDKIIKTINEHFTYFDIYKDDKADTNKIIKTLDKKFDVKVDYSHKLGNENNNVILGSIDFKKSIIYITNKLEYESPRWRFTLAHEIGHYILHRESLFKRIDLFNDVISDVLSFEDIVSKEINNRMEVQANIFASNFLIPDDILNIYWNIFRIRYRIHQDYLFLDKQPINIRITHLFIDYVRYIFGISKEAAILKLINRGIIVKKNYTHSQGIYKTSEIIFNIMTDLKKYL